MSKRPLDARAHAQPDAGFSLMEMLIAISILALVLAFLPGAFRLAHRTWDATAVLDRQARHEGAQRFLQARLAEALPLFEQLPSGIVRLMFSGTSEGLSFIAPSANGPQGAGLYRFTLETKPQGARMALVVTVAAYVPPGAESKVEPEEHVLVDGITGASYRYFGRGGLRQDASWQSQWNRSDALPDAIELSIAAKGSAQTILVRLRLRNTS